jgi:Lrp/AsnC family transcriptional regulator
MQVNQALDDRDRAILALLQVNADVPINEISDRVSLSASACSRRISRLIEEGYITRRVALLDRKRMNVPTTVFVILKASRHSMDWLEEFRKAISEIPEIIEVHRVTGNFDYIMKVVLRDIEHYDQIYKRLVGRADLFDVSAYFSMETMKQGTAIPTGYA